MMDASAQEDEISELPIIPGVEGSVMDREMVVTGAIVDSWVEPAGLPRDGSRLILQVAPSGRPKDLMIVEAEASLVGDRNWLEDLGENLCHGSPVAAVGRLTLSGLLWATQLRLAR
jgi:hypothetical protein